MDGSPRISIVTPSYNQARYIGETIESVLAQDYPDVEHIVIDGGSADGTLDVLAHYPHLRVVSEPDRGHADAVNKGFRLATGRIWAFLNSDDTLVPGALRRVAQEMDPAAGRHVVMGRCRFVDERGRPTGIEHPSQFESHRRVLEVWKGHTIPQPAVFWTPEVWARCGPMDETLRTAWIDYDLFCRFSRRYRFHPVDQVFAQYRLHAESKTEGMTEADPTRGEHSAEPAPLGLAAVAAPLAARAVPGPLPLRPAWGAPARCCAARTSAGGTAPRWARRCRRWRAPRSRRRWSSSWPCTRFCVRAPAAR